MARPQKAVVDYFPHNVKHGKSMLAIESRFGNDGYAFWFKLLEILGETEGHVFDCNNPVNVEYMLAKTHVSEVIACEIIDLLAKIESVDRELWSEKIIWCQHFVDGVTDAYKRRKIGIPQKPSLCKQKPVANGLMHTEISSSEVDVNINPQSKVKESKVKNIKDLIVGEKIPSTPPEEKKHKFNQSHMELAQWLLDCIKKNKPDFKEPNLSDWADAIRLMMERDKRKHETIQNVIEWCQLDSFWKSNILSADKLRKQFDKLEIQMNQHKEAQNGPTTGNSTTNNGSGKKSTFDYSKFEFKG
jgi:hypothetical protein